MYMYKKSSAVFFGGALFFVSFFMMKTAVHACTVGVVNGAATTDGRPIQFKVRDTSVRRQQLNYYSGPASKYSYIGVSTEGTPTIGVNSAGLVIGNTRARVQGERRLNYFRNANVLQYILSQYGTVDEVQDFFQRQIEYSRDEFTEFISGNFPFIDRTGRTALFEVYKPDPRRNPASKPFVYVYDAANPNRDAQGLLNVVCRAGELHLREDGMDDESFQTHTRRYETARYNLTGLMKEGRMDVRSILQGNHGRKSVRISGLEMGLGGTRTPPGATAYFAPAGSPFSLTGPNNVLKLTATVKLQEQPKSKAHGFRMVLSHSGSSRMINDGRDPVKMNGYMVSYDPAAGTYGFRSRRDNMATNTVSTIGAWSAMEGSSGQLVMAKDTVYTVTLEAERLNNDRVQLRFTVSDGNKSETVSYIDEVHKFTDFDTVAFGSAHEYGVLRIENISVRAAPSGEELLGDAVRWFQINWANNSLRPLEAEENHFEVVRYGPGRALPVISRHNSMSTIVTQGVKPDEDPALTTAWVVLGIPNYVIAVPTWVHAGDTIHESLKNGQVWDRAQSLFLKGADVPTVQTSTFPAEAHLLNMVYDVFLPHWRENGMPAPEEMARVHRRMAADAYSLLNCLDKTRIDNQAPVIRCIESRGEGALIASFSIPAQDPDGTIVSYEWNFGDRSTSSEAAPRHAFPRAGTYLVSCTVTDNEGVSTTGWSYVKIGL